MKPTWLLTRKKRPCASQNRSDSRLPSGGPLGLFGAIADVGAAVFQEELVQEALPHLYYQAIMEHKLQPIAAPRITMTSKEPLIFEAMVAQMPEVKIKKHRKT